MLQLFNFAHGENIFFKESLSQCYLFLLLHFRILYLYFFEQNSSFVLSNVPIVKSTKVCYEQLAHLFLAFCFPTVPKMNRDLKTEVRTEPRFLCTVTPLIRTIINHCHFKEEILETSRLETKKIYPTLKALCCIP